MSELTKKISSFILDTVQTVVLALSIFVIVYLFVLQPHQVRGSSMYSNLENNDFLLTDKISYRFKDPQRGEVIVFKAPPSEPCAEQECEYIKRIIGLPGEKIKVQEGSIFVNDKKINEEYLPQDLQTQSGGFLLNGRTIILGDNEYLALGDNRPYSRDGREFGPIKKGAIIGKAWLRYWPLSKLGLIPRGVTD